MLGTTVPNLPDALHPYCWIPSVLSFPEGLDDDWLINIQYPDNLWGRSDNIPSSDMVIVTGMTPGAQLYNQVIYTAGEALGVGIEEIFSVFEKRHYAASKKPICDLGFFNCCTVDVIAREGWVIEVQSGYKSGDLYFEIQTDPLDTTNDFNDKILALASEETGVSTNDLYALYNGTPLRRQRDVSLLQLGMHDRSQVTIFRRMRGGVIISRHTSGRKRAVSLILNSHLVIRGGASSGRTFFMETLEHRASEIKVATPTEVQARISGITRQILNRSSSIRRIPKQECMIEVADHNI